jgi:hypothetical protein
VFEICGHYLRKSTKTCQVKVFGDNTSVFIFFNKLTIPLYFALRLLNPEGDLATIVHGDLHNNNMMFLDQEEPVVFKLLDWQLAQVLAMYSTLFFGRSNLLSSNYLIGSGSGTRHVQYTLLWE